MTYELNTIYHCFNQGNNRQEIFFKRENYLFFLEKMRTHLHPVADVLSYCLMPNHFHWLIMLKEKGIEDTGIKNPNIIRSDKKNQQQKHHVDQRCQVHSHMLAALALELHWVQAPSTSISRSPCTTSTSLMASCSMLTTRASTRRIK